MWNLTSVLILIFTYTLFIPSFLTCLFVCCFRKRRHFSLQPVKAAMRQPRFFWSTLPIARSLTILTSYPEISPRNACITTLFASWMSTTWLGALGFTVPLWAPPAFLHLSAHPMTTLATSSRPSLPRRFAKLVLGEKEGKMEEKIIDWRRRSLWMGRVICWTRQLSCLQLNPSSHHMAICLMWPLLPWHRPSSSLHLCL